MPKGAGNPPKYCPLDPMPNPGVCKGLYQFIRMIYPVEFVVGLRIGSPTIMIYLVVNAYSSFFRPIVKIMLRCFDYHDFFNSQDNY